MTSVRPVRPDLEHLRHETKHLLLQAQAGEPVPSPNRRRNPPYARTVTTASRSVIAEPSVQSLYLVPATALRPLASATGFVAQYQGSDYLVTNWHVLSGRNPTTGQALDQPGASLPDRVHVLHNQSAGLGQWQSRVEPTLDPDGRPLWLEHSTHGRRVDVAALRLTQTQGVALYPHVLPAAGPQLAVGVSDGVSIVGFPFGRTGGGQNS